VRAKIGVEPTGDAFNSISLAPGTGCPLNPMINADPSRHPDAAPREPAPQRLPDADAAEPRGDDAGDVKPAVRGRAAAALQRPPLSSIVPLN
jgi:hypothetical protein